MRIQGIWVFRVCFFAAVAVIVKTVFFPGGYSKNGWPLPTGNGILDRQRTTKYLMSNGLSKSHCNIIYDAVGGELYPKGFAITINDHDCAKLDWVKDMPIWRLDLSHTKVADLTPIGNNGNVVQLDLGKTPVKDLGPLGRDNALKCLTLNGTKVTDLSPLSRVYDLESLDISDTQVTNLLPLAIIWKDNYRSIVFLADNTGICDISPLAAALRFTLISIEHTKVADLSPLHELKEIRTLRIRGIPCDDFSPVPVDGLDELRIDIDKDWKGLERLRTKKRLEINGMKPEEFWKEYDRLKAERDNKAKEGVMGH